MWGHLDSSSGNKDSDAWNVYLTQDLLDINLMTQDVYLNVTTDSKRLSFEVSQEKCSKLEPQILRFWNFSIGCKGWKKLPENFLKVR